MNGSAERSDWFTLVVSMLGVLLTGGVALPWLIRGGVPTSPPAAPSSVAYATTPRTLPRVENWRQRVIRARGTLEFVIATVPDPIDSRHDHGFDSQVESIQFAATSADWVFDFHEYPWRRELRQDASRSDPNTALDKSAQDDRYRAEPGVLLFRHKKSDERRFLAVLLVGETPTTGVHVPAMMRAFDIVASERSFAGRVRILGPRFTGGKYTLREAIDAWCRGRPDWKRLGEFSIISGTAASIQPEELRTKGGPSVTYSATCWSGRTVKQQIAKHLEERGITEYAELFESLTAYGAGPPGTNEGPRAHPYVYPFQVSLLAARYDDERQQLLREIDSTRGQPGALLRIPFPRETGGRELPAPFNSGMAEVRADHFLRNALRDMAAKGLRCIVINATDPRDALFLSARVKGALPNAQLILTSVNTLMSHEDYQGVLYGALLPSSYPLTAGGPTPENGRRYAFPSPGEQGTYNALALHLNRADLLRDCVEHRDAAGGVQYGPRFWWLQIGRRGIYPIERFCTEGADATHLTPAAPPQAGGAASSLPSPRRLPTSFLCVSFGILAGSVLALISCRKAAIGRHKESLLVRPRGRMQAHFWTAALFAALTLCGVHLYLTYVARSTLKDTSVSQAFWALGHVVAHTTLSLGWLVAIAIVIDRLLGTALLPSLAGRRRAGGPSVRSVWMRILTLVAIIVVAAAAASTLCASLLDAYEFERYTSLDSGLSPVVPFLIGAALILLVIRTILVRIALLERHCIPSPFQRAKRMGVSELARVCEAELTSGWDPAAIGAATAVLAAMSYVVGPIMLSALPLPYSAGAGLLFLMASGALTYAAYRFYRLSRVLSNLLNRLGDLPMVPAWNRLPHQLSVMVGRIVDVERPRVVHWRMALQLWDRCRMPESSKCDDAFRAKESLRPTCWGRDGARFKAFEERFHCAAGACWHELQSGWKFMPAEVALGAIDTPTDKVKLRGKGESPTLQRIHELENFCAATVVIFLAQFLCHLRAWFWFLAFGSLLLILFVASYPFVGQRGMLNAAVALGCAVLFVGAYVLVRLSRDSVLSWVSHTKPGQITWDRSLATTVLALVPLAVLILHHLTGAFEPILMWLAPVFGGR